MFGAISPFSEPQNSVASRTTDVPPVSPAQGSRYIVADSATGLWAGHDRELTVYNSSTWTFYDPPEGMNLWVDDEDLVVAFDGSDWVAVGGPGAVVGRAFYTAAEALSALRGVRVSPGGLLYARPPELEALAPIGITRTAALTGERIEVCTSGPLTDAVWTWTVGSPVLLGLNGALTHTQPVGLLHLVVVGRAVASDTIIVNIESPKFLLG